MSSNARKCVQISPTSYKAVARVAKANGWRISDTIRAMALAFEALEPGKQFDAYRLSTQQPAKLARAS